MKSLIKAARHLSQSSRRWVGPGVGLGLLLALFLSLPGLTLAVSISQYPIPTANSNPAGITKGPDGNLWFTEQFGNRIGKISPTGAITEYSLPAANSQPYAITAGPDGNLWFTEAATNNIGKLNPTTGAITEYAAGGTPQGITAGPDGNLWFTEASGNQIGKITPAGTITLYTAGLSINANPVGITAGPDGNLWFTEGGGNRIGRITPAGAITEYSAGLSANSFPLGLTAGPDGNLWFTEAFGNRIGTITPAGVITEYATGLTANSYPVGIASGPDGNLWFTQQSGNQVGKISPTGVITEYSAGIAANSQPYAITAGPDGNMWFTELNGNGIGVVNLTLPTLSINSVSQPEGNSGLTPFVFTVTLSQATLDAVTVDYSTANGTALAPGDYTTVSGTLVFAPGETTKTITVNVIGDTVVEPDEAFTLSLGRAIGAIPSRTASQGIGTIQNDDAAPGGSVTLLTGSGPNPSAFGQPVTFVATVVPPDATGTITLKQGVTVLGTATLVNAQASFTLNNLLVGNHALTAYYSGDATHTGSVSDPYLQVVTSTAPPPPEPRPFAVPADLVGQLRVTPDREFGLGVEGDNTLVYSLTVKNVGEGRATSVRVRFPIDSQLAVGYITSTDPGVWVEQIVTDTTPPYVQIAMPPLSKGESHSAKVVMRAGTAAKAGSSLFTTYQTYWDDAVANGRNTRSNGVRLSLTAGNTNRNDTDGQVQYYTLTPNSDGTVSVAGDFYAPGEGVDLWYTDPNRQSKGLGRFQADAEGKLSATVSLQDWPSGQSYVIAGRGVRTDIYGAGVVSLQAASRTASAPGEDGPKRLQAIEVSEPGGELLRAYLTEWAKLPQP